MGKIDLVNMFLFLAILLISYPSGVSGSSECVFLEEKIGIYHYNIQYIHVTHLYLQRMFSKHPRKFISAQYFYMFIKDFGPITK